MDFGFKVVVCCDRFGDGDETGCARKPKFAEKIQELMLEEVFKDPAVRDEHGSWYGIGLEPFEQVAFMEMAPRRGGISSPALLDLT